jgi:hypothetical protein
MIMGTMAPVNLVGGRSVERYSSTSWAVVDGKPEAGLLADGIGGCSSRPAP